MKLALYTTIYPGVEAYFQDWKNTVLSQTDKGFDLWVGVDGFEKSDAEALLAGLPNYQLVFNDVSHSKAAIRRKSLKKIAAAYDGVVLVDSDDRLLPTRISSAREYLKQYDVVGCPMALVNESGVEMGQTFGLKRRFSADQDILYANRFGLSNTAYRCDLLDRCLSMPDEAELFDWYLATVAWLHDAKIIFDHDIQMQYRQYDNNTTQVLGPFSSENILSS
ncbi:MAG: hypothetical protein KDH94_08465, partial [Coxiellaceae bacterium]|nr:hypothetical protein [Coxiellaceae bacterium]